MGEQTTAKILSWEKQGKSALAAEAGGVPYRIKKSGSKYHVIINGQPAQTLKTMQEAKDYAEKEAVKATWPADTKAKDKPKPQGEPLKGGNTNEVPLGDEEGQEEEGQEEERKLSREEVEGRVYKMVLKHGANVVSWTNYTSILGDFGLLVTDVTPKMVEAADLKIRGELHKEQAESKGEEAPISWAEPKEEDTGISVQKHWDNGLYRISHVVPGDKEEKPYWAACIRTKQKGAETWEAVEEVKGRNKYYKTAGGALDAVARHSEKKVLPLPGVETDKPKSTEPKDPKTPKKGSGAGKAKGGDRFGMKGERQLRLNPLLSSTPRTVEDLAQEAGLDLDWTKKHCKYWVNKGVYKQSAEGIYVEE